VDPLKRLDARENVYFRKNHIEEEGKTKSKINEQRRTEMVNYNMKTFGNVSIGIHGTELPNYASVTMSP
jgi:hypothetical protein